MNESTNLSMKYDFPKRLANFLGRLILVCEKGNSKIFNFDSFCVDVFIYFDSVPYCDLVHI